MQADGRYVRYRPDVETMEEGESETIDRIIAVMAKGGDAGQEKYSRYVRTSHAKPYSLLRGEFQVLDGLPQHLRQGLFFEPRTYGVIARMSQVPGDLTDDRKVSAPRGIAVKIIGVEGPKLPPHAGEVTQDWVLDTGKIFNVSGPGTFLAQIAPVVTMAPRTPELLKGAISNVTRVANEALNAVGVNSALLDFFGHPFTLPLGEPYYSQAPIRFGDYIAKLRVTPVGSSVQSLRDQAIEPADFDGLVTIMTSFFRENSVEFEVAVQLCTDLDSMPVENANVEWPEEQSPYQLVGRMFFSAQDANSDARRAWMDEALSFCPAHALEAHRPLGGIMRARMRAYEVLGRMRRERNGKPAREPRGTEEVPD